MENIPVARFLAASQIGFYWIALVITVLSGAIYFWKNAAIVQESMENESLTIKPEAPLESIPAPAPAMTGPTIATPAFKEWEAIVEALGQGAQIVPFCAKAASPEGARRFLRETPQVLALPHRLSPAVGKDETGAAAIRQPLGRAEAGPCSDLFRREVTDAIYLASWEQVARLDDVHFWGEEIVQRTLLITRTGPAWKRGCTCSSSASRASNLPHKLAPSKDYGGCKSWIDVPIDWEHDIATHVVRTEEFMTRRSRILAAVSTVSLSSTTAALPKITSKLAPHTA